MAILETRSLCKRYGTAMRVNGLNLSVPEGSIYGFLGPNGAGKSTTLKMALGLVHPTSGAVKLFGKEMNAANRRDILRRTGSLIEAPSYYGHLTGKENLEGIRQMKGAPEKDVDEVLCIVRLDGQKDKRAAHYSLGMKQRLGLAGALLGYPKLLILDEPTNGLDPAGIQEMRELILELPERFGMTVVVSSHFLSEIDQIAGHVGIIREGELVFQDSMAALHGRSTHHLELRTENDPAAARLLRARGIEADIQDGRLTLPVLTDGETAEAVRALVESRVGVMRLEERQKSLEDIFLELTGRAASL